MGDHTNKGYQFDKSSSTSTLELPQESKVTTDCDSAKDVKEKPYHPFQNRHIEHPNSTIGSTVHLMKGCLGSGILAMPSAFKNAGLVTGSVGTLLIGLIATHTVYILVKTSQEVCVYAKKPLMGYAATCGAAFTYGPNNVRHWGKTVRIIVDISMTITYIALCCVYVVFIASSFKEVIDVFLPETRIAIEIYCAITFVPLALICQIRNLKYLVPFSAAANILVLVVFSITLYYVFSDLPDVNERVMVAPVTQWPLFFSTVIFAMEGIGVVMPVENEMARPEHFLGCPGVLNVAMIVVISLYAVVGFFGYVKYGDAVLGSLTFNLPQHDWLAQTAKLLMAIVMYFSYALQFYVPMETISKLLKKRKIIRHYNIIQISIRTLLVLVTVSIAAAFPNLELVISFVGAVFMSTLGILIPAIIDTVHRWDRGLGPGLIVLWKNLLIGLVSIFALVAGVYAATMKILNVSEE